MENESVTGWIDQLYGGNEQAAEKLWQHISARVREFARQKLDAETRCRNDEGLHDGARPDSVRNGR